MNSAPTTSGGSTTTMIQRQASDSNDLRNRVVEILSGTTNGCLTELGYYPGMPKKMQELETINAQWQQENVKLFQDNRSLARALQAQSERLKLITGPEIPRLNALHALENKVQGLAEEKANLIKRNEALMANQPQGAEYSRLHSEYTKLTAIYGAALNEISQLRHYIQIITTGQHAPLNASVQPVANSSPRNAPPFQASRQSPEQINPPQNQMVPHAQWPQSSHRPHSRPTSQQGGHMQPHAGTLAPSSSGRVPNPYPRPISAPSYMQPNHAAQGNHPPLSIQTTLSAPPLQHYNQHLPLTPMSAVNSRQNLITERPFNSAAITSPPGDSTQIQPNGSLPTPPVTALQQQWSQDTTRPQITPGQLYPPLRMTSASVAIPDSAITSTSGISACSPDPAPPPTPNPSRSTDVMTVSSPRQEHVKRGSVDMSDVHDTENQQHKKQRLAEPDPVAEQSATQDLPLGVNDMTGTNDMEVDEESDDDGVVEIGPDGLRLEEDCITVLIEDDDDDDTLQTCILCRSRFDMGYTSTPLKFLPKLQKRS